MATIDITTQSGAVGNGDLQLQNGAPMDATLRFVTDAINTASPLMLSTGSVTARGLANEVGSTAYGTNALDATTTGIDNTGIGYNALSGVTTGSDNTGIGHEALFSAVTGNHNTAVGRHALRANTSGTGNSAIGSAAMRLNLTGTGNSAFGYLALENNTNSNNTALGYQAGINVSGGSNIAIGFASGAVGASASTISIGRDASATASNQGVLGGNSANGYVSNWYFNGVTHTAPYSVTLNASGGSGSNVAGASISKDAGKGTGTGASGNNVERTSVKGSSGSTLQSSTDRHNIIGKYVDITESAATTFGNLALTTSGTIAGGMICYTVEANDATDYQSLSGFAPYSVVNKAGTLTYALGFDEQSSACSVGTLTGTLSLSASGTTLQFQMNAVSSLVQTTLRISFQVLNQFGVATISAA